MVILQEEDHRTHFCTFFMEYEDHIGYIQQMTQFFVMKKDQEHEEHEEDEEDEEDEEEEDQEEEEEEEEEEEQKK